MPAHSSRTTLRATASVAAAAGVLLAMFAGSNGSATAAPNAVAVGDTANRFTPNTIPILIGERVTFSWASGGHRILFVEVPAIDLAIDAGTRTGTTSAFVQRGTYFYYCAIHATAALATAAHVEATDAMVGSVVVLPQAAAPPPIIRTATSVPAAPVAPVSIATPAPTPVRTPVLEPAQPASAESPTPARVAPLPPATGTGADPAGDGNQRTAAWALTASGLAIAGIALALRRRRTQG